MMIAAGIDAKAAPRPAVGTSAAPYTSAPHAEDEVPLGREEALPQDRHREAPGPSRVLEPHPREEVAEAQAGLPEGARDLEGRRQDRHAAARGQRAMTRVKRSVH